MPPRSSRPWYREPRLWLEAFVIVNIAFLSLDIWLAHSVNKFAHPAESIPLYFSIVAPLVLLAALGLGEGLGYRAAWRDLGYFVGWIAVGIGLIGLVLHLDSRFFEERTIKSLVYAAPFAAPLAYTGLGLLLIVNRMIPDDAAEWSYWVLLMALGGFLGNFVFSLTDHAQNGFFHATEWIPVVSSSFAVGFLTAPFLTSIGRKFLRLSGLVLLAQAGVGLLGAYYHLAADLQGPAPSLLTNLIDGAPVFAPLLFPNLVLLAGIALWTLRDHIEQDADAISSTI
ncbi:hypothetical protein SAMN05444166_0333 [Singulisphaera sp. GP187]|uniref:hypothetical protein n=1 Tax=Singulisphaera sp. GP187 TaxID=1882752 RepID=UPI000925E6DD|nr:hypothetical protein [Singulisphaera sp. GP187]SIN71217.1 hypothetical protein SAMN05444166_0333 [Singulisphaera sp. GP187]